MFILYILYYIISPQIKPNSREWIAQSFHYIVFVHSLYLNVSIDWKVQSFARDSRICGSPPQKRLTTYNYKIVCIYEYVDWKYISRRIKRALTTFWLYTWKCFSQYTPDNRIHSTDIWRSLNFKSNAIFCQSSTQAGVGKFGCELAIASINKTNGKLVVQN